VLPSDMQWKKQDADVETDGGGEATFAGPWGCLLAAQSPVVEAELLAVAPDGEKNPTQYHAQPMQK
jgi:hypothetical protein